MSKFLLSIILILAISVEIFAETKTTTEDPDDGQVEKPGVNITRSSTANPIEKSETLSEKVERTFVAIKHAITSIGYFIYNLFPADDTKKAELVSDTPKSALTAKLTKTKDGVETSKTTPAPQTTVGTTPPPTVSSNSTTVKA